LEGSRDRSTLVGKSPSGEDSRGRLRGGGLGNPHLRRLVWGRREVGGRGMEGSRKELGGRAI